MALHEEKSPDNLVAAHQKKEYRNQLALVLHHLSAAVCRTPSVVLGRLASPTPTPNLLSTTPPTSTPTPAYLGCPPLVVKQICFV